MNTIIHNKQLRIISVSIRQLRINIYNYSKSTLQNVLIWRVLMHVYVTCTICTFYKHVFQLYSVFNFRV